MSKKDINRENDILLREEIKRLNTIVIDQKDHHQKEIDKIKSSKQ